jgi:CelD/BcsL family acetyltransferase involved in cellulose biosynthesis
MQSVSSVSLPARSVAVSDEVTACPLVTTVEQSPLGLERHRAAWDDLVAHAAEPNPFFEPHALLAAWRHLPVADLRVVLVWAAHPLPGKPPILAGLFPVVRSHRYPGLSVLGTWKHLYSYLGTPLVRADRAQPVLEALFAWLRDETDAALFEWRTIRADGPFRNALTDTLNRLGFEGFRERGHTRAMFSPQVSADDYLAGALPGKKRKELRRQERRLAEAGTLGYDELAPDGNLEAWLDEFIALEERGWKGRSGTALRCDPAALGAFRDTARGAFACGRWMTLALRLDGRAIAMRCNLRAGAGAVAFKIAYDETYARFSPGVLLEVEHVRRLHIPGAPLWIDSGAAPDHPMIDHLWRDRVAIENLLVPTGRPLGELAVAAMPLARWLSRTVRAAVQRLHSARG